MQWRRRSSFVIGSTTRGGSTRAPSGVVSYCEAGIVGDMSFTIRTPYALAAVTGTILAAAIVSCVGDNAPIASAPDDSGSDGAPSAGGDASVDGSINVGDGSAADSGGDAAVNGPWTLALTSNTQLNASAVDPVSGDIFVAGSVRGDAPELGIMAGNGDNLDALVIRLDGATGKVRWAKAWGGGGNDAVSAITLTGGALNIVGSTTGATMNFVGAAPGATLTFPSSTALVPTQSFVARIDGNSGAPTWAFTPDANEAAGTNHSSRCGAIVPSSSGLLFVGCSYSGGLFGVPNLYAPSTGAATQAVIFKLNSTGSSLGWVRSFASTSGGTFLYALATSGGFLYASGSGTNTINDVTDAGVKTTVGVGTVGTNGFVARFPEVGGGTTDVAYWKNAAVGDFSVPTALTTSATDLLVAGSFAGKPAFGLPAGTDGGSDIFLARLPLTLAGGLSSFTQLGGSDEDDGNTIVLDGTASPSLWLGGKYLSPDLKIGTTTLPAATATQFGGVTAKLSPLGVAASATGYYTGNGSTTVSSLAADSAHGYLFTAGTYGGNITFDDKTTAMSSTLTAGFVLRRKL